jgi:hypothetical protein
MKTFMICVIISLVASFSFGQPQLARGVYSASGFISFSSTSTDIQNNSNTTTVLEISPSLSLFVSDGIELTLAPSLLKSSSESSSPPSNTSRTTSLGIQAGFRYYFPADAYAPFVGAGAGLAWSKYSGSFELPFSSPLKTYFLEGGIDFFVTSSFAVEPSVRYRGTSRDVYSDTGILLSFGVKYFVF